MDSIEFRSILLKENNYRAYFSIAGTIVLGVIPALVFIFGRHGHMEGVLDFTLFYIWMALAFFFSFSRFFINKIKALKPFDIFGSIAFTNEGIKLDYGQYLYSEIINLTFSYGGKDGEAMQNKGRFSYMSEGINSVSFTKDGNDFTESFYLENESEKEKLREVLTYLYTSKIKFQENDNEGRTYMLYKLNKKQISEFKEKLQLD